MNKIKQVIIKIILLAGIILMYSCDNGSGGNNIAENNAAEPETITDDIFIVSEDMRVSPGAGFDFNDPPAPEFADVSVHDPSVFRHGDTFYVIGSHMASAKTSDFIKWEQISSSAARSNKLVPDAQNDFKEALDWGQTRTFWAGDIHAMPDGRFFMYYCVCEGSKPLGGIGLAIADEPEGPYINQGLFLKSGMTGRSPNGGFYNAAVDPNAVDPQVFFDAGGQFWMVYGSYSGGIYILKMNPETGLPVDGQGYGTKLLGGNHSRIEAPYIIYSPDTEYYYLFVSFGGLAAEDGYNIRISRSKNPDGPYYDAAGNDMANCKGKDGSFFDDKSIEPYGTKIIGGYRFRNEAGEPGITTGYLSPGHNSAYYDADAGRYYLIFHTRFTDRQEAHEVRVHEMFLNKDGWLTVSPFRYDGNVSQTFTSGQAAGSYKIINHGNDINKRTKLSELVNLNSDRSVTGGENAGVKGSWSLGTDGKTLALIIDGTEYNGRFIRCYDKDNKIWVSAFTALSKNGIALWGGGLALK
jgi:arabinan endo-1,5-alpha-L-arabinosidase